MLIHEIELIQNYQQASACLLCDQARGNFSAVHLTKNKTQFSDKVLCEIECNTFSNKNN